MSEQVRDELLSCPFCGGEAESNNFIIEASVQCGLCWATISRAHNPRDEIGIEKSIKAWNTRSQSPMVKALVEAARPARLTISYPFDFLNEQSETMEGQTQTTKLARDNFEQYRKAGMNPQWINAVEPKPDNKAWTYFAGIEIDSFPALATALAPFTREGK